MTRRKGIVVKTFGSMTRTATRKRNNAATQATYIALWGRKDSKEEE